MKRTTAENGTERKKGNLYLTIAAALIFLAGAAIFLYPTVSNYLAKAGQEDAIRAYEQTLEAKDSSFYAEEWKKAREYNDNLTGDPVRDPFLPGYRLRSAPELYGMSQHRRDHGIYRNS